VADAAVGVDVEPDRTDLDVHVQNGRATPVQPGPVHVVVALRGSQDARGIGVVTWSNVGG